MLKRARLEPVSGRLASRTPKAYWPVLLAPALSPPPLFCVLFLWGYPTLETFLTSPTPTFLAVTHSEPRSLRLSSCTPLSPRLCLSTLILRQHITLLTTTTSTTALLWRSMSVPKMASHCLRPTLRLPRLVLRMNNAAVFKWCVAKYILPVTATPSENPAPGFCSSLAHATHRRVHLNIWCPSVSFLCLWLVLLSHSTSFS